MNFDDTSKRFQNLDKIEKIFTSREFLESKNAEEAAQIWTVYLMLLLKAANEQKDKRPEPE